MTERGYIYAVRCGDFVKIGWSLDPIRRTVKINSDNPMPCTLLGYYEGTKAEERAAQKSLAAHHSHSEWFRFEGAVIPFCASLTNKPPEKKHRKRQQHSPMHKLAKKHGQLTKWARELGVHPNALSQWRRVPVHLVARAEAVTGIPRQTLRPDIFGAA